MGKTTFQPGDAVALKPDATYATVAGPGRCGVIESVVTDTPPDAERGLLYHIKLTHPLAPGHWGSGYVRNYADELERTPDSAESEAVS